MMDSPVPTGAEALLGGLCDCSGVTEAMRPAVLDQTDSPRARVCWHSGRAQERKVWKVWPLTQERRWSPCLAKQMGTVRVLDVLRWRIGLGTSGPKGEATVEFSFF